MYSPCAIPAFDPNVCPLVYDESEWFFSYIWGAMLLKEECVVCCVRRVQEENQPASCPTQAPSIQPSTQRGRLGVP